MNKERIKGFRDLIYRTLANYINDDFSLLDIPYHNNIGDSLIYLGELEFLKKISSYKLLYKSSARFGVLDDIPNSGILLLHGGGNFGDLWHESHEFRKKIITCRPNQRIIVFPQTVYYRNKELIKSDSNIYGAHKNLILCARDQVSYQVLKKYFKKNTIFLLPDMAFFLNVDYIPDLCQNELLFLNRSDLESDRKEFEYTKNILKFFPTWKIKIEDWPGLYEYGFLTKVYFKRISRLLKYPVFFRLDLALRRRFFDSVYGLESNIKGGNLLKRGVDLLAPYEIIYTNRLHGMILSILMGKIVYCYDNSYGKNSCFYNTWLQDFDGCNFINDF